jgi:hypothetical protein
MKNLLATKVWNKSNTDASWNADVRAICIFPNSKERGNICARTFKELGTDKTLLDNCLITIEDDLKHIAFQGTFQGLIERLKLTILER